MTRDVSESVLFHALLAKVNTGKELWYPLTSASLLLCHPDRTIQNTPKFKQLLEPEKQINSCSPGTINVRTVNGMFFFFYLLLIFDPFEKSILQRICKQRGMEIHLLFDKTFSSTIKDSKKNKRDNNSDVACQIISAEQKPQSNLLESLRVDQLTEA